LASPFRFLYLSGLVILLLNGCRHETLSPEPEDREFPGTLVDLTHEFSDETVYWVTSREFELDTVYHGTTEQGYYYSAYNFATAEHGGTHLDAPIHFSENGQAVEEIPLKHLIGEAIKIDVSVNARNSPDYRISVADITAWESREGMQIPPGAIVLFQTGYSDFYPDRERYMGTAQKGEAALADLHFPGLSAEAAEWLVANRYVHAVGIDTPSIDYGQSKLFEAHVILLGQNIPAFENLANLDKLPAKDFRIIALPMKIKGGSGAPLRIVALLASS
jgi:kynurenine formamidase